MKRSDYILLTAVGLLILLGIIVVSSVSTAISQQKFGYPTFYLFHHVVYGLLPGIFLGFLAFKIPLSFYKKLSPILLLLTLFLMVLVFLPGIGLTLGGSHSWINLGVTSFQPSELLKLTFILYLASWLAGRIEKGQKSTFAPFLAILGIIILLLALQPDVGTLGVIFITAILMYFLAGMPLTQVLAMIVGGAVGLGILIKMAPYRMNRFLAFIDPNVDPMGIGYQIKQALIAIGSGGILGTGLGLSVQRFGYLPQPMADSIFASYSEETGFLGSVVLLIILALFLWLGFSIAKRAKDNFSKLAALGITGWLTVQSLINIGAMLKLLPLTGIPLPFVSYGGSALVTELIAVGILLNISKNTS
jgi:cell division protein FtsW